MSNQGKEENKNLEEIEVTDRVERTNKAEVTDRVEKVEKPEKSGVGDEKKSPKTAAALAAEFFIKVAITALVVIILCTFVIGIHVNHSNSNYPMIKDGDLCVTFKIQNELEKRL